MNLRRT
ncbi:hypothetical protein CGLO_13795 [Colletotrichum gloeosporioides Cg-14]|nr:hypothetical protein CGLO_13795 [Colletotrichum gloeosporioides Cg-14]